MTETASYVHERTWFTSGGDTCRGILTRPEGAGPFPAVVMAPGLATVRAGALDAFAEQFALAGYVVLAFDYRGFGDSSGSPRQVVDPKAQREDYRNAVARVRELPYVDADRVVLWGSSYSGGHVLAVAADDPRIAAVIAQAPHISASAGARAMKPFPGHAMRLSVAAVKDLVGALRKKPPLTIPVAGVPGSRAVLTSPDALPGYRGIQPEHWVNEIAARWGLVALLDRPAARVGVLRCPLLVQVLRDDEVTPPRPALRAAQRAPRGVSRIYEGGHFDCYVRLFDELVADQLAFLAAHVPSPVLESA